jgi:hypothetical protein
MIAKINQIGKVLFTTLLIINGYSTILMGQHFRAYKTPAPNIRSVILDPKGKEFVMRGVNLQSSDWDNPAPTGGANRYFLRNRLPFLASKGVNAVRICWRTGWTGSSAGKLTHPTELGKYIGLAAKQGIVSVVSLMDFTGFQAGTSFALPKSLIKEAHTSTWWAAYWFAKHRALIQGGFNQAFGSSVNIDKYLILNPVNELSDPFKGDNATTWVNAYSAGQNWPGNIRNVSPITYMRRAGYKGLIIIDAFNWAQDPAIIKSHGQYVLDPLGARNIGYGVHMYDAWKVPGGLNPATYIPTFKTYDRPVIIGEFAHFHDFDIDEASIMNQAQVNATGWFAWTLWGEGARKTANLDMLTWHNGNNQDAGPSVANTLTAWGQQIFGKIAADKRLRANFLVAEETAELAVSTPTPKLEVTVGDLTARLFPNPTGGAFNLEFNSPEEDNIEVAVYDLKGSRLKQYKQGVVTGENRLELMAPDQPGVYVVQALTNKGKRFASTLVVSE